MREETHQESLECLALSGNWIVRREREEIRFRLWI